MAGVSRSHGADPSDEGVPLQKRLVTRYATVSREAADENQGRVEAVFDELSVTQPQTVSYIVLRLADDSFLHLSFHAHGDDEPNPIRRRPLSDASSMDTLTDAEGPVDAEQQADVARGCLHHRHRLIALRSTTTGSRWPALEAAAA